MYLVERIMRKIDNEFECRAAEEENWRKIVNVSGFLQC
jgi:hypothetical protein